MKQILLLLIVTFIISSVLSKVTEDAQFLSNLQAKLKREGNPWVADGESDIAKMPLEQFSKMLTLLPGNFSELPPETILPENTNLPNNFVCPHTPVKNQGNCGSCYSFAAVATYEGLAKKQGKNTLLSEQDFMMKANQCNGWYLDKSMALLQSAGGILVQSACPYLARPQKCATGGATHRIGGFGRSTDAATIKQSIHTFGPINVGFAVYADFRNYKSGYYKFTSGALQGYHAVAIVGYDDKGFYVKNSWGTGWGDQGYFRIEYSQMKNQVQFGTCFGGSYWATSIAK